MALTTESVCAFLNGLLASEPEVLTVLFDRFCVRCSNITSTHPSLEVRQGKGGQCFVGPIEILNAMLREAGEPEVWVDYDVKTWTISRFAPRPRTSPA